MSESLAKFFKKSLYIDIMSYSLLDNMFLTKTKPNVLVTYTLPRIIDNFRPIIIL